MQDAESVKKLWSRILAVFGKLQPIRRSAALQPSGRRAAPNLICRCAVSWEAGRQRGRAELRQISPTGMRLRADQMVLAGSRIAIRPLGATTEAPSALDVVFGTVVYSRSREGKIDLGVELLHPEKISRFAWFHQLRGEARPAAVPADLSLLPRRERLQLVRTVPGKAN